MATAIRHRPSFSPPRLRLRSRFSLVPQEEVAERLVFNGGGLENYFTTGRRYQWNIERDLYGERLDDTLTYRLENTITKAVVDYTRQKLTYEYNNNYIIDTSNTICYNDSSATTVATDAWTYANDYITAATDDTANGGWITLDYNTTGTTATTWAADPYYAGGNYVIGDAGNYVYADQGPIHIGRGRDAFRYDPAVGRFETEEEREARMVEARAARRKARRLLLRNLTPEQRVSYRRSRSFVAVSPTGVRYLIKFGRHANVYILDEEGKAVASLCGFPSEKVPNEDTLLAQKMMLESCEEEFLEVANLFRYHQPREVVVAAA